MTLRYTDLTRKARTLLPAAALLLASHAVMAQVPAKPAPAKPDATVDRGSAYYHDGLAHLYEELAVNNGRPDYAAQAIEEYKLALNADPNSKYLQDGLADLYFRIGRIREAVSAAQDQVKKDPNDISAHTLLGKVYLRSLGDMQGTQAAEMLRLAIGEYEKLTQLKPKDLETHLILGQLYGLNHDSSKAEAQFKLAQTLDSNSEDAVLNMARLYNEQGDPQRAIDALRGIPADDRTSRVDLALGASLDQMHKYKEAAAAYRAAVDEEPDNTDAVKALGASLLADNELSEALTVYTDLAKSDPTDPQAQMKISEIQRRQGHYDDALVSLNKAKTLNTVGDNLELVFDEAVLYDALGKYDQAASSLQGVLATTTRPDGKYSEAERNNRATFLDRLGVIYREQNKTPEAVAQYKLMIELGGDNVIRGYQGEVESYRDAHQWKEATAAAAQAAKALPKDRSVQLLYAFQLAITGQPEQGLALANAQLNNTPDDRETQVSIANIDLQLHRSADAMAHLDKAATLSTKPEEHAYIALLRATVLDRDKKFDEAEVEYRKALAFDPNNATVLNDLGYMLADRSVKLPEALKMLQKAVELDPQNGSYLDSLGWVYFKMGQYGPAEENLHKAIERTASDASIHDHLGQVYEKTGRLKLAVSQWERSMTEYARSLPVDADPADVAKVKRELDDARTKLARVSQK
jgi:Flp pilus assembly protein TadD